VRSLLKVKERFRDVVDIQVVAFPQEGIIRDEGTEELLEKSMELGRTSSAGCLGTRRAVTTLWSTPTSYSELQRLTARTSTP